LAVPLKYEDLRSAEKLQERMPSYLTIRGQNNKMPSQANQKEEKDEGGAMDDLLAITLKP